MAKLLLINSFDLCSLALTSSSIADPISSNPSKQVS